MTTAMHGPRVVPVDRAVLGRYLDGCLADGDRRVRYLVTQDGTAQLYLTVHDLTDRTTRITFERLPSRPRTGRNVTPSDVHPQIIECTSLNARWSGVTVPTTVVPDVLRRWMALEAAEREQRTRPQPPLTEEQKAAAFRRAPLPIPVEGVHEIGGRIVKVVRAVHGSGRLYAMALDPVTGRYDREPGLVDQTSKATLLAHEDAAYFGRLYGRCVVCGATLTDPESVAAGIGPVCVSYFGMTRAEWLLEHGNPDQTPPHAIPA